MIIFFLFYLREGMDLSVENLYLGIEAQQGYQFCSKYLVTGSNHFTYWRDRTLLHTEEIGPFY